MTCTSASLKQVQRQRRKENIALASPPTLGEILFIEQYMNRVLNGQQERFLLADSVGEKLILVFGSEASAGWSNQMEHVFMDGTFSVCHPLFHQLFIILSKRGGFDFPVGGNLGCGLFDTFRTNEFLLILQNLNTILQKSNRNMSMRIAFKLQAKKLIKN